MDPKARWLEALTEGTARVQKELAEIARREDRTVHVGVGASGDKSLLADVTAERVLLGAVSGLGKNRIISEEAGESGDGGSTTVVIIDPLDGSSNFSKGIPFYSSSVGVVMGGGLPDLQVGVVRNLVTGDVYTAEKGKGAKKNGKTIRSSRQESAKDAVVAVDMSKAGAHVIARLVPLLGSVGRAVHYGSAALELCMLGEGKLDGVVDLRSRMRIVDFAAGYLIASEAGAVFSGEDGKELSPAVGIDVRFNFIAAGTKSLHAELLRLADGPG